MNRVRFTLLASASLVAFPGCHFPTFFGWPFEPDWERFGIGRADGLWREAPASEHLWSFGTMQHPVASTRGFLRAGNAHWRPLRAGRLSGSQQNQCYLRLHLNIQMQDRPCCQEGLLGWAHRDASLFPHSCGGRGGEPAAAAMTAPRAPAQLLQPELEVRVSSLCCGGKA
jgi:hypothetical protein